MTSRIHRGFHRIGIVLAVPFLILGLAIAYQQTWIGWDSFGAPHAAVPSTDGSITYAKAFPSPQPFYGYAIAWTALGLALYAAARAVGWILAGFIGSEGRF